MEESEVSTTEQGSQRVDGRDTKSMGGTEMKKSEDLNRPTFVNRDGMLADKEYVEWLADLKRRYRQSQLRAAVRANSEVLEYYWSLGRDIVAKKAESKWGSGFFNQLSLDMRAMFPGEKGFSSANLRYMKRWYEFYYQGIVNMGLHRNDVIPASYRNSRRSLK